jgi:septal ring factor EnvC (AmiA/AmiB activator)
MLRHFCSGILTAMFVVAVASAAPPPPEQKLKAVEGALEQRRLEQAAAEREAETLAAEIGKLRIESVAAAKALHEHEAAVSRLEEQLAGLATAEKEKLAALHHDRAQHEALLMALERVARHPPESLALSSQTPVDVVRGGLLITAALPALQRQARALETELAELAELREEASEARRQMAARLQSLAVEQSRMSELIHRKSALQSRIAQRVDIGQQRLAQLSAQAADLRELIERLEAERKAHEAELLARAMRSPPRPEPPRSSGKPLAEAKGSLILPVAGKLVRRWGEPNEVGTAALGLTFAARPGAQVVAPWDGRVEFAGPFRGYGQILIIEHGDGYHSLLAGLERIDVAVGQALVAGEPVGVVKSGEGKPSLYLELRRHGQPIDPLPWLSLRDEKVTG